MPFEWWYFGILGDAEKSSARPRVLFHLFTPQSSTFDISFLSLILPKINFWYLFNEILRSSAAAPFETPFKLWKPEINRCYRFWWIFFKTTSILPATLQNSTLDMIQSLTWMNSKVKRKDQANWYFKRTYFPTALTK